MTAVKSGEKVFVIKALTDSLGEDAHGPQKPLCARAGRYRPSSGSERIDYPVKGASRSLISSIDEIASRANSLLEGETVVDMDPAIVDPSFVRDRLDSDTRASTNWSKRSVSEARTLPSLFDRTPRSPDATWWSSVIGVSARQEPSVGKCAPS